jgi:hypothetical protein
MANIKENICYYCGKQATTKEHVPPLCFFPIEYRKQLITVPSCDEHNYLYKLDDEYVRNILTMLSNDSSIRRELFKSKSIKSFQNNPALGRKIISTVNEIKIEDSLVATLFEADTKRINKVMSKIGYGLYYYTFHKAWSEKLNVFIPKTISAKNIIKQIQYEKLLNKIVQVLTWTKNFGENKRVFTYKWGKDRKDNLILRLQFYDDILVYVFPNRNKKLVT